MFRARKFPRGFPRRSLKPIDNILRVCSFFLLTFATPSFTLRLVPPLRTLPKKFSLRLLSLSRPMSALSTAAAQAAAQAADPKVISGTAIAKAIRLEIKAEVVAMAAAGPKVPGLAVILVGSSPDSQSYVRMKKKACAEAGINSYGFDYPVTVTEAELVAKVGGNALQCE